MKKLWKSFAAILAALLLFAGCNQNANHVHTEDNGTVTTAATCTVPGVKTYKCTECGEITRTEEIAATGHSEAEGTVTRSATITSVGVITYCCSKCETEIREVLFCGPLGEDGNAATSSSTYVYFGVFPKTVLASTSTVTVEETSIVTMGGNTYYKGSDGEYYAKVTENGYESSYTYNDGTTVQQSSANSTRYFKVEPIKWKVLTTDYNSTGKALLLAEDILTSNVKYYVSDLSRTIGESTVYANNYKYSTIRAYLNGSYETDDTQTTTYSNKGFLQTAFTEAAQNLIATTTVVNNGLSTTEDDAQYGARADGYLVDGTTISGYPDYTCADTQDKIFFLSEQEVTTTAYGFASFSSCEAGNTRIRKATDYAKANFAHQNSTAGYGGWWWLRTPYYGESDWARNVHYKGSAGTFSLVNAGNRGVVPALSISLQ